MTRVAGTYLSSSIDMASELRELPPAFSSVHTRCACSVRPGATAAPKPKSYNRVSSGLPRERGDPSESEHYSVLRGCACVRAILPDKNARPQGKAHGLAQDKAQYCPC